MIPFIHPTELKKRFPFLAKKSLGQNFLIHRPILGTLAKKILQDQPRTILEIGPGPGSLSQLLAPRVKRMILVEKDSQFKDLLEEVVSPLGSVEIYFDDFLKFPLEDFIQKSDAPVLAVGNLPYNVSVPILQKLLYHRSLFSRFFLMFQKEVALRLTARPSTKAYGSLSLYCQMLADLKLLLPIPPSAFDPRPKVESAVVEITPLPGMRIPDIDLPFFEKLIQAAFNPRRKTLLNNLRSLKGGDKKGLEDLLISLGIDPTRRGETLSLKEFSKICLELQN
jgi:16S rRNA (adenine1518-N6/adenine1519-N6)-dimethyltransferase